MPFSSLRDQIQRMYCHKIEQQFAHGYDLQEQQVRTLSS